MEHRETSPALTQKDQVQERHSQIDNALSEALMYCSSGRQDLAQFSLKYAFRLAELHGQRITPQEIAYVMSGGSKSQPAQERYSLKNTSENSEPVPQATELNNIIAEFKSRISEFLEPVRNIEKVIDEVTKKVLSNLPQKTVSESPSLMAA